MASAVMSSRMALAPRAAAASARVSKTQAVSARRAQMMMPRPPRALQSMAHAPGGRGGILRVRATSDGGEAASDASAEGTRCVDVDALARYMGATSLQLGFLVVALFGLDFLNHTVLTDINEAAPKAAVGFFYLFLAFRSRVFSPLDNSRPKADREAKAIAEKKRPSWMPPPLTFPIVWSTIGVLRSVSSVIVWEASGQSLLVPPLVMMLAHLAIGDTWNTVENVEKRQGTAAVGVLFVLASAFATDYLYFQTSELGGLTLAPLCVWLTVATALVWSIWSLNGKEEFLPMTTQEELAARP